MLRKTCCTALFFFIISFVPALPQTFNKPATGLRSHETLEILKVDVSGNRTAVYLAVENRIKDGSFCADRNIYIISPDGTRLKLESAYNIPQCPEYYKFKSIGERLYFTLTFPALKPGTGWIDIIEDCNENCFRIYGILLNDDLTRGISEAVKMADNGQTDTAIKVYKGLIERAGKQDEGITASLYSDLVTLLVQKGYSAQASEWYLRLLSSELPHKQLYIDNLNSQGIKF